LIGITQIIEFKSTTPYRVSGGIVNLSWKTRNSFFCLLITGFRLRYFKPTSSELNIVLQKDQKFNLISFGLFSIASKKIIVSVNQIKKEIVLKRKIDTTNKIISKDNFKKPIVVVAKDIRLKKHPKYPTVKIKTNKLKFET
jgi:hypothetical protein